MENRNLQWNKRVKVSLIFPGKFRSLILNPLECLALRKNTIYYLDHPLILFHHLVKSQSQFEI